MRRTLALTAAALCLLLILMATSAFPHWQRAIDVLLAGGLVGLAVADEDRRRSSLVAWLGGSLLLIGALDLRGWPVLGLWGCAVGVWFLRQSPHSPAPPEPRP